MTYTLEIWFFDGSADSWAMDDMDEVIFRITRTDPDQIRRIEVETQEI